MIRAVNFTPAVLRILCFMAWRNIWRYPVRSALTGTALLSGLVMVILYGALLEGMRLQMEEQAKAVNTGDMQIHHASFVQDEDLYALIPSRVLEHLEERFSDLGFAPRLYTSMLASTEERATGVMVKGVDVQREPGVTILLSKLRSGEANLGRLEPGRAEKATESRPWQVLVGTQLAKTLQLDPGAELVLVGQAADGSIANGLFRVAGVMAPVDPAFDRAGVLMSVPAWRELMAMPDGYHELAIRLPAGAEAESILQALRDELQTLPEDWVVRDWQTLVPMVANMLAMSQAMLLVIGGMVIGLASLGMLNTMLMAVHERQRELGILMALGMNGKQVVLLILLEAAWLALLAGILGCVLGWGIGHHFEQVGINFSSYLPDGYDWGGISFEPVMRGALKFSHFWQSLLLMLAVTLLSAALPAARIVRQRVVEALR